MTHSTSELWTLAHLLSICMHWCLPEAEGWRLASQTSVWGFIWLLVKNRLLRLHSPQRGLIDSPCKAVPGITFPPSQYNHFFRLQFFWESFTRRNKGVFLMRKLPETCWERCTGRFPVQKGSHCKEEKEQSNYEELKRGSQSKGDKDTVKCRLRQRFELPTTWGQWERKD